MTQHCGLRFLKRYVCCMSNLFMVQRFAQQQCLAAEEMSNKKFTVLSLPITLLFFGDSSNRFALAYVEENRFWLRVKTYMNGGESN